jgi:hypothetical protein
MSYRVSRLLTDPEPTTRSVSLYIEMQMIGVLCVGAGPKDCCKPAATGCTNGAQNWGAARLSETSGCGKLNRNRRYRDDGR